MDQLEPSRASELRRLHAFVCLDVTRRANAERETAEANRWLTRIEVEYPRRGRARLLGYVDAHYSQMGPNETGWLVSKVLSAPALVCLATPMEGGRALSRPPSRRLLRRQCHEVREQVRRVWRAEPRDWIPPGGRRIARDRRVALVRVQRCYVEEVVRAAFTCQALRRLPTLDAARVPLAPLRMVSSDATSASAPSSTRVPGRFAAPISLGRDAIPRPTSGECAPRAASGPGVLRVRNDPLV